MTISIGPVEFARFEVPSVIHYGGTQRIATHYLTDGRRSFDLLGPEEFNIRFAGVLAGTTAVTRSRELEDMRRHGQQTILRWGGFAIPVILNQLALEYHNESWIHYSVSCFVVDDTVAEPGGTSGPNSQLRSSAIGTLENLEGFDTSTLTALADETRATLAGRPSRSSKLDLDTRLRALELVLANTTEEAEQTVAQENALVSNDRTAGRSARTLAGLTHARTFLRGLRAQIRARGDV